MLALGGLLSFHESNDVVAGHEKVRSMLPTCAAANGRQSSLGFGIFKYKDKRYFSKKHFKDACIGASFSVQINNFLVLDTRTTQCVQLNVKLG